MIEHRAEHGIKRKLRVEKRCSFKQQIELVQSAGAGGAREVGDGTDAREQIGHLRVVPRGRSRSRCRTENDSIAVFDAEGDGVAIAQQVAINLGAIYKYAVAVAAVLQAEAGALATIVAQLRRCVHRKAATCCRLRRRAQC